MRDIEMAKKRIERETYFIVFRNEEETKNYFIINKFPRTLRSLLAIQHGVKVTLEAVQSCIDENIKSATLV